MLVTHDRLKALVDRQTRREVVSVLLSRAPENLDRVVECASRECSSGFVSLHEAKPLAEFPEIARRAFAIRELHASSGVDFVQRTADLGLDVKRLERPCERVDCRSDLRRMTFPRHFELALDPVAQNPDQPQKMTDVGV